MKKGEVYWYAHKDSMIRVKLESHLEGDCWETSEGEYCDESFLTTKQKAYDDAVIYLSEQRKKLDVRLDELDKIMRPE